MSQQFVAGAEFQSYAAFQTAFDEYCRQNAISNVPLAFVRQSSKKLAANTFSADLPLDRHTIDRFVYKNLSLVCVHHRSHCSNKNGLFCEGRITIRFDRLRNVLMISSFIAQHSNHSNHRPPVDNNSHIEAVPSLRDVRLNRIFGVVKQIHDDALKMVEDVCEVIREKWDGDNNGMEIHLIEKENDAPPIIIAKSESQSQPNDYYDAEMPPIKQEMLSQEHRVYDENYTDNVSALQDGNNDGMFGRYNSPINEEDVLMTVKCGSILF